jgi:hypothetical protein
MLCRRCEASVPREIRRAALTPAQVWGAERIRDLLCTRCGTILAGEDVAHSLVKKQSQLAQFGLAGHGPQLFEPGHSEE